MKTFLSLTILTLLGAAPMFAQAPVPNPNPPVNTAAVIAAMAGKSPLEQLKIIREQNAKLIEQQQATLKTLEEMEKTSNQLKFFGKRS